MNVPAPGIRSHETSSLKLMEILGAVTSESVHRKMKSAAISSHKVAATHVGDAIDNREFEQVDLPRDGNVEKFAECDVIAHKGEGKGCEAAKGRIGVADQSDLHFAAFHWRFVASIAVSVNDLIGTDVTQHNIHADASTEKTVSHRMREVDLKDDGVLLFPLSCSIQHRITRCDH